MTGAGGPITDAVIVGAGAAGNLFAALLAEAGKSVLVLEPGPAWKTDDLFSSLIWSRRLRWGGPAVESTGAHAFGAGAEMLTVTLSASAGNRVDASTGSGVTVTGSATARVLNGCALALSS